VHVSDVVRWLSSKGSHSLYRLFQAETCIVTAVTNVPVVVRCEVKSVDPCIWRVMRVPQDLRLGDLHRVLQLVMGWHDRHPHGFQVPPRLSDVPRRATDPSTSARQLDDATTIGSALSSAPDGFIYSYLAENPWHVRIKRTPGTWKRAKEAIACLDGYLAGPREDAGGAARYNALLAATLGRGGQVSREELERFGPGFDPERFDRCGINRALAAFVCAGNP